MKALVIAEKPSVGRDIARVLGCKNSSGGCPENDKYVVTWALGHLVTLSDPESYSEKYKEWQMESLPMMPKKLSLTVIPKTGHQFRTVKSQMDRKDVEKIIIATDAGREGELVARWIIEKAGVHKPIQRLWISSVTDKAIREGFARLKDGRAYEPLYQAAVARAEADWLVGLNATRALTVKYNAQLSCGRVQTPTLALIQKHNDMIKNFKPQKYYGITLMAAGVKFSWQQKKSGSQRTFNKEEVQQILKKIKGQKLKVVSVEKRTKKTYAPLLYDLTELQRDANRLYNFSAKETLNYMQSLYERHKVLTYPRTDSRYLTEDIVDTLKDRVRACSGGDWAPACAFILRQGKIKGGPHFVNNSKVGDHHAIIPTEQGVRLSDFEYGERKIYELVVKRFLAVLMPPYVYDETVITGEICGEKFTATGAVAVDEGWHVLLGSSNSKSERANDAMGKMKNGMEITPDSVVCTEGMTEPPAGLTEAGLLSAMENPVKYMEEQNGSLAKTLCETGGLGTVATRADIIDKLFNTSMIEKRGQYIHLTSKGRQVLTLAPAALCTPKLTAQWEQKLSDIAAGKLPKGKFESEIRQYTAEIVNDIKGSDKVYRHDNLTGKRCPQCGKLMLLNKTKNGSFLACQDRNCGYRKNIAKVTNARCPQCHKKLELTGEGENKKFICSCGYREKLSTFNERKKESGGKVSKRDVAAYMKKQAKEALEPVNQGMMEALKNIKL